ncbi:hypothetical protein AMEX_G6040 [Astyanax mexicanus]|uniref:Uncharacterized protein n=1 Tax=Astyanax mexicanus TaxID=7994 RepID=A0A8T2M8Y7_ASTMX|nr:hypothetical protein AMEX_G6040 [Astyanax mexicanus]
MPYLGKDLAELIKSLMRRFVKREVLQDITTAQLTKLDIVDQKNLMPVHCVDIGLGAEEPSRDCLNTLPADDCLDPTVMSRDPDGCKAKMKGLQQAAGRRSLCWGHHSPTVRCCVVCGVQA